MIVGDGTTAAFTRTLFDDVPWLWICDDALTEDAYVKVKDTLAIVEGRIEATDELLVTISTQLPIGSHAYLSAKYIDREFAVIPENYRTTKSLPQVDRFVVGTNHGAFFGLIEKKIGRRRCFRVSPETAEMTKHALNGFLALSVQYAHEIAILAKDRGADPEDLARCLRTDSRIGMAAYLRPEGDPGDHLRREVHNLFALGGGPLIDALEATCWPS